jgi:glycosyltransferase involved in cell wall biosynthesis
MKILHVHDQPRFQGGVERILFDMASSLQCRGEQGLLFTDGGSDPEYFEPFDWQGMSINEAIRQFMPDVAIIHKVSDAGLIEEVTARVPTLMFVHDHDLTCPRRHKYTIGSNVPCEKSVGIGCITSLCVVEKAPVENLIPVRLFEGYKRQQLQHRASRGAAGFIVGSQAMRQELIQSGIPGQKISVLAPIPKSIADIKPVPLSQAQEILYVGQVIRGKGVDLLVKAFKKMKLHAKLTIVGSGNHLDECMALSEQLGIADRVTFRGWVNHTELNQYYEAAQIVAVPSRWPEPFGMVGVEAMARGRPVVAFNTGGIGDWLQDGVTGLLCEPGDTQAMANQMQRLLIDDNERIAMSQQARQRVVAEFTHEGFINGICEEVRRVSSESSHLSMCSR